MSCYLYISSSHHIFPVPFVLFNPRFAYSNEFLSWLITKCCLVVCDNIEIGGMKFVLLMRIGFGISDVNVSRSISKIIGI